MPVTGDSSTPAVNCTLIDKADVKYAARCRASGEAASADEAASAASEIVRSEHRMPDRVDVESVLSVASTGWDGEAARPRMANREDEARSLDLFRVTWALVLKPGRTCPAWQAEWDLPGLCTAH